MASETKAQLRASLTIYTLAEIAIVPWQRKKPISFRHATGIQAETALKEKTKFRKTEAAYSHYPSTQPEFLLKRYWKKCTLGATPECNLRSKIRWFTEFCNSHYVSHFAAFFIDRRTEISVAKSCIVVIFWGRVSFLFPEKKAHSLRQINRRRVIGEIPPWFELYQIPSPRSYG